MNNYVDYLLIATFLLVVIQIWRISNRSNNSILLRLISVFTLLHALIFPILYTFLINTDPKSIEIDDQIFQTEKKGVISEVTNLDDYEKYKLIISDVLKDSSKLNVDKSSFYDIVVLDKYLVKVKAYRTNRFWYAVNIYNSEGEYLIEVEDNDSKTIKEVLLAKLILIESLRNNKKNHLENVKKGSYWSYKRILPYSLNILFNSNFNPKSKLLNLVYFIHHLIVFGFVFSLIIGLTQKILSKD